VVLAFLKEVGIMAHDIESMFYVGEPPWHGLGVPLQAPPTTADAIRLAGLEWEVITQSLQVTETGAPVSHRASVRASDGRILGVVGPVWTPLQNREAFTWFDPFLRAGVAQLETAGSLRHGERVWILARIAADPIEIVPGDPIMRHILLSNGHDGILAARAGFTDTRVVCANTLAAAHTSAASQLLRVRHTARVWAAFDAIRDVMDVAEREFRASATQYRALAAHHVHSGDLEKYVRRLFRLADPHEGAELAQTEGRLVSRVRGLFEHGQGNNLPGVRGTWWAAYNAVSEYLTHTRGTSRDVRLNSLWFGEGASLNRRALELAAAMAA
jgi:phage/plasmid-like protein (TIGR03299 family)